MNLKRQNGNGNVRQSLCQDGSQDIRRGERLELFPRTLALA